jgi:hypothetical protein
MGDDSKERRRAVWKAAASEFDGLRKPGVDKKKLHAAQMRAQRLLESLSKRGAHCQRVFRRRWTLNDD